jgi:predicted ATPase
MLQSIQIQNFKSFREATLPLAPLTVLIGANASGKSNAIEAMQLLSWLASGRQLGDLLLSIREQELSVRGTLGDFLYTGNQFTIGCTLGPVPDFYKLKFRITLGLNGDGFRILDEALEAPGLDTKFPLYCTPDPELWSTPCPEATFTRLTRFEEESGRPNPSAQLQQALSNILFLDPIPRSMRDYSYVQEKSIQGDGAALSAVLYRLREKGQKERILDFIRSLPEQDIRDIDFISTPRDEVMVQLEETFGRHTQKRDAAVLSDGTLRVLAVAAALLSVPEGSTVVIEEIDNGVHPSRAALLLDNIKQAATERSLKVLLTTHNPALLDALPVECIPDVVACYRDPEEGDSRLIRLEDLGNYPELVAQGPLGRLVTQGVLDRMLKDPNRENPKERVEQNLRWLQQFERSAHES